MSEEFYQITHERLAELTAAEAELSTLRAQNAALVEALKPFAQETAFSRAAGALKQSVRLPLEYFEAARDALAQAAK